MSPQQLELLHRVEVFSLNAPDSRGSFTQRLARENGWSIEYAARVIYEYKRFAFLAVASGHPVTPSDPIDQVWHLHLCNTRSYWEEFCGKVLQTPLHHEPTRGGFQEVLKHEDQYARTLTRYQEFFGEPPPPEIWPSVEDCFKSGTSMVRVNLDEVWTIPKPNLKQSLLVFFLSLLVIGCTPMAVAGPILAEGVLVPGPIYLTVLGGLYALVWFITLRMRWQALLPGAKLAIPADFKSGSDFLYERAYLVGGPGRVVDTVLMKLIREKRLAYDTKSKEFTVLDTTRHSQGGLEEEVLDLIERDPGLKKARAAIFTRTETFARSLDRFGLLADADRVSRVRRTSGFLCLLLLVASATQLFTGIDHHRPIIFLIVAMVIIFITLIAFSQWRPVRNQRGEVVVEDLLGGNISSRQVWNDPHANGYEMDLHLSLLGMSVLHGTQYAAIAQSIAPTSYNSTGSNSSGCSSSGCGADGGGGCGSGCGGCGGGGD